MLVPPTTFFDPNKLEAAERFDRGFELFKQNDHVRALAKFDEVLKIDPEHRYAKWNRTLVLLCLGDYTNGFPLHDTAWGVYDWGKGGPIDQGLPLPIWNGERCRVLAYHNMGFGDAIMLLRFLPEMVARCESVTLVVRKELVRLFQGYGATIVNRIPDITQFDAQVSFFNSMFTMGHTRETIPNKPYIPADFKFTCCRMGIVWSGNSRMELDLDTFLSLLDTRDFELHALQFARNSAFTLQSTDFKDTSEFMMKLDCIVTVDTAVAHLAGAIGHPNAHMIIPYFRDWRWWHKDVWYPTLNVYPQEDPNDWDTPFRRVNEAVHGIG